MLSTEFSTFLLFFGPLALVISLGCAFISAQAIRYSRAAVAWLEEYNAEAISLKRLAEVEIALTELTDSYQALLTSHKKLRSRIGMREVREKRRSGNGEGDTITGDLPDPTADPEGWKKAMRLKLRTGQLKS